MFEGDKNLKTVKIRSRVLKKVGKYAFRSIHRKAVFQCPKAKKTKKDKRGKMILKKYKKMIIRSGLSKSIRFKN